MFTSAGTGPVPRSARLAAQGAGAGVDALPARGASRPIPHAGNLDDWISCAQRGLFAYDWSDIVADNGGCACELLAAPLAPIRLRALPSPLREIAAATSIAPVVFGENDPLSRRRLPDIELPP
ncbi:hypothetical protein [Lysobacter capsici]|uniref:hypothetical protein n=1 Tax=Lysobacter capsici TaxID=435897 RepID=UPI001C005F55|nr:hypothetical protein [Lysobacter capsici]QWF16271.1 hypothetical protein KME82_21345 [Lysobacter capsici]